MKLICKNGRISGYMRKSLKLLLGFALVLNSCQNIHTISEKEFRNLMNNVANGWSNQDTELALSSFDIDAIYMEPPNIQYYRGHKQLRPYFNALTAEHSMKFHHLWFNPVTQTGAGEYTFSYGKNTADTGIVVVEIQNGKIMFWREYQRKGPVNFSEYLGTTNKEWEWHIGNYPVPTDSLLSNE